MKQLVTVLLATAFLLLLPESCSTDLNPPEIPEEISKDFLLGPITITPLK